LQISQHHNVHETVIRLNYDMQYNFSKLTDTKVSLQVRYLR